MKKSKTIFYIAAILVVAVICVCFIILPDSDGGEEASANITGATIIAEGDNGLDPNEWLTPSTLPEDNMDVETIVENNVTIRKVEKDPNEVIDRTAQVMEDHPEYLDIMGGDPYICAEGKVCRNDKVISIDIYDAIKESTATISFGYITGVCNRFIYLNPEVKESREITLLSSSYYFCIDNVYGGGYVATVGVEEDPDKIPAPTYHYTFNRALENKTVATYTDPQHPGVFWYTHAPVETPVYIDIRVFHDNGFMVATLRLTIDKDESDGTYSIVDIDNKNLLQNNSGTIYSTEELEYIVAQTNETYNTPNLVHMYTGDDLKASMEPEECIIEQRDHETGLYYNQFIPCEGTDKCRTYSDTLIPILAVTWRGPVFGSMTLYFWVIQEPTETSHGSYQYIGRDFPKFQTFAQLELSGYSGQG